MPGDAEGRLAYLADSLDLLWPGTAAHARVVLPSPRVPRLVAPRRPRRAGAAALVRYTAQQGVRERVIGLAAAAAVRVGLADVLPDAATSDGAASSGAESVDALLSQTLGEPVASAMPLSPARANRKPVLQVLDRRGRTVAFAKIGVSPLARTLVVAEAESLELLARSAPRHFDVPRVLHRGAWRGTEVLVTTALPIGRRVRATSPLLLAAMRELADQGDPSGVATYLDTLQGRAAALPADVGPWTSLLQELTTRGPVDALTTGYWHGDWTTWNCSSARSRLVVWDWERLAAPAPRGFDLLHFTFNQAPDRVTAARSLVADAASLLRPWGFDADAARVTAGLYLLDVALRYVTDGNGTDIERWAAPAIRAAVWPTTRGASAT